MIPAGVQVSVSGDDVVVSGKRGQLGMKLVSGISARVDGGALVFERAGETTDVRAKHGLMRALARNMIAGIAEGFTRKLEIQGVGYRAEVKGKTLVLNLGFSHPVEFPIPSDVSIAVEKDGKLVISGLDRARVGQVAANIRKFRPPDRYKGKGVRFEGERVVLKEGKSA
ncbi:MAG TPA: 50S ribosomal protein L6 [Myxococcota bacterium]|nr:50S ribosomal protein L6 [Myxococcota bacterium]